VKATQGDTVFINRTGTIVSKDSARFFRVITKMDSAKYKIEDFYLMGQRQMLAFNSTPQIVISNGKYIYYDSLGFISSEGEYKKGYKAGLWKYYYFGTNKIRVIRDMSEDKSGYIFKEYDSTYQNLYLEGKFNKEGQRSGIFKSYYSKENKLRSTFNFSNGKREGEAKEYYSTGEIKRIEFYKNDKLIKGELFDRNGEKQKYYPSFVKAELGEDIFDYLMRNVKVFNESKKYSNMLIQLTVTKFGNILDIKVLENDQPNLNEEIINLISRIKHNKPGKFENQIVDQTIEYHFRRKD
jgi:antitoxin component YwqK of YwqJK toxin-antitoxin module